MLINDSANNLYNLITKKSFEISYILCRISQSINNDSFKKVLDEQAVKILNSATTKDINGIKQSIFSIEYFMHLAKSLNLFRYDLADTIIAELNNLNNFIAEYVKYEEELNSIDYSNIFKTKLEFNLDQNKKDKNIKKLKNNKNNSAVDLEDLTNKINAVDLINDNSAIDSVKIKDSATIDNSANINDSAIKDSAINSAIEKNEDSGFQHISAIINKEKEQNFKKEETSDALVRKNVFFDKIRYFEEFRLRDLEQIFPELSERTIRYYLSDLINKGFIEKRGSSGPNVLYKVKKTENITVSD